MFTQYSTVSKFPVIRACIFQLIFHNTIFHSVLKLLILYFSQKASESRLRGKLRRIENALETDPVDVETLAYLAITGDGLINNDIRCKVWPKLLLVNIFNIEKPQGGPKKRKQHCKLLELLFKQLLVT